MNCQRFCATLLLLGIAAHPAAQTTNKLTFDAFARSGGEFTVIARHPEECGYLFSSTPNDGGYATWNTTDSHYRGSVALFSVSCCEAILSRTNGGLFSFRGFDFAGGQTYTSGSVYLTGYLGLQAVVQETFFVPSGGNFQIFATSAFTNITELRWVGALIQFDNVIVVSATNDAPRPVIHNFRINSITQCQISGMTVGKTYAFEASSNLVDWVAVQTWSAISTFGETSDFRYSGTRFYRIHELP